MESKFDSKMKAEKFINMMKEYIEKRNITMLEFAEKVTPNMYMMVVDFFKNDLIKEERFDDVMDVIIESNLKYDGIVEKIIEKGA